MKLHLVLLTLTSQRSCLFSKALHDSCSCCISVFGRNISRFFQQFALFLGTKHHVLIASFTANCSTEVHFSTPIINNLIILIKQPVKVPRINRFLKSYVVHVVLFRSKITGYLRTRHHCIATCSKSFKIMPKTTVRAS
jgi:hypothetical protein